MYVHTSVMLYKGMQRSWYHIRILSWAPAHMAWLIPRMADCGEDQHKSRQDRKRNRGRAWVKES